MYYRDGIPTSYENPCLDKARKVATQLNEGKCPGSNMLGWMDLPQNYPNSDEFKKIQEIANQIQAISDVLVVIGIGGSYAGAKAGIEFVGAKSKTKIIFAGNNMSTDQLIRQKKYLEEKNFSINVISKSGTTTEPAIAFRFFKDLLEERYGKDEAAKRIYATTDANKGALREMAELNGYKTFVIPDNVGGRYSVLTAVGLLPMAVAGLDIEQIMRGAAEVKYHDILSYAAYEYYCHDTLKKPIELLAFFDPDLYALGEWWKQLVAESSGKDYKGIWPSTVIYSTDLHSEGQSVQEGPRILFETFISISKLKHYFVITHDEENLDNLNYLEGKSLDDINYTAMAATIKAHSNGQVPCSEIHISEKNEYEFGQLVYFFECACAIFCNMIGVNAFNQPGVEAYKKEMFEMLGKPGYEKNKN